MSAREWQEINYFTLHSTKNNMFVKYVNTFAIVI